MIFVPDEADQADQADEREDAGAVGTPGGLRKIWTQWAVAGFGKRN